MTIKLHHSSLNEFNNKMFNSLIYPHNCASKTKRMQIVEFYDEEDSEKFVIKKLRCQFYDVPSTKGITKTYALTEDMIRRLPIKIVKDKELVDKKTDKIVHIATGKGSWHGFGITSSKEMELRDAIRPHITPHTAQKDFEVYIVICHALLIGRGACWLIGNRACGKSSVFKTMHKLYDNIPVVERPKTVPAFYKYIPQDGILVLDEMAKKDVESASNVQYALNIIGDVNENTIRMDTGGSSQYGTNVPKKLNNCSCVCISNRKFDYENMFSFIHYMFPNNPAMHRRFLKMRMPDGELDFSEFLDWESYSESEIHKLRNMNRTIKYYKDNYKEEANDEWVNEQLKRKDLYSNTHIATIRLFLQIFSIYCKDSKEAYIDMCNRMFSWIKNYNEMVAFDGEIDAKPI